MGHETAFKSITGSIFEFGFSDAILADVGGVPVRVGARPAASPIRRLRDAGGDGAEPPPVHRGVGIAREIGGGGAVMPGTLYRAKRQLTSGPVGDRSIFRREIVFGENHVGRKHGPVPFTRRRGDSPL